VDSLFSYFDDSRVNEWLTAIEQASNMRITEWASMFEESVQEEKNTCGAYVVSAVKAVLTSQPHDWPRKTLASVSEMKLLLDKKSSSLE
jgi:hypothetical protein